MTSQAAPSVPDGLNSKRQRIRQGNQRNPGKIGL